MPSAAKQLKVLAIEPFFGGSHRRFLEDAAEHSRFEWKLVTGKPVHWKWRMRSAPLELARAAIEVLADGFKPDVIFCTDMLDLPSWRGILGSTDLVTTPTAIYFHENQLTYPVAPKARIDHHFGYTNLLSALTADSVIFNSQFHLQSFQAASRKLLSQMPDGADLHDLKRLDENSEVVAPGFSPPTPMPPRSSKEPLTIGWVARWEYDKRPDRFEQLVDDLDKLGLEFRLILLGSHRRTPTKSLESIRLKHQSRIIHDGFAASQQEYWQHLRNIDLVVSTADHEFFGIAVCEAIWAGAIPILPNRLNYPDLAPSECLYDELEEATQLVINFQCSQRRTDMRETCRQQVGGFQATKTVAQLDRMLERLIKSKSTS
ncbi:MAG: DUF3524 domain-containing protein [Rubripirellula sp.]|nr:DUF3524 domain-containing protein [Rubripirellula sp.]